MSAPVTFAKKSPQAICSLRRRGGPEEDRTLDLCVANAALSQLSYGPVISVIYYINPQADCQ